MSQAGIRRWSTADVDERDRLAYFASALSEVISPLGIDNADARTFQAELGFAHLGPIGLSRTTGSPHSSFRGQAELARARGHCFSLLLTLQSPWSADHLGEWMMRPHDVLVIDTQKPLRIDMHHSFVAIGAEVSEGWLRQWLPDLDELAARRIPGNASWGLALSSYLSELSPELAASPPLPLSVLADQLGVLLALTAGRLCSEASPLAGGHSLHDRVADCITQRCTELQLTASEVAASLDISVRTLHRCLAAANETFVGRLVQARAQVGIRMLTAPSFERLTMAEIGRRAGFLSSSHFARVIFQHTGLSPARLRRSMRTH